MSSRVSMEDITIVDVDVHVNDTPREIAPYIDMPWRRSLEYLEEIPWRYLSIPGYAPQFRDNLPLWPGGNTMFRLVDTPAQMMEDLASFNIDIGILFPDHLLLINNLPQIEYASALARAYNAYIVDKWCDKAPGLKGCIVACSQDPEDAAREIEKYKDVEGIVGIYLPCAGLDVLWGHKRYDPIFHAAESAGLPLILHSATTLVPHFPNNVHQYETLIGQFVFPHCFSMMANMLKMMEKGIPVRFPNLKICFEEAGISWVPFMMMRLDKVYLEQRREWGMLEHPPSHYIKNFYYATQPIEEPDKPEHLKQLIDMFEGEDKVMFASDWPHHDFDHPRQLFNNPAFSPELKRKILGENALKFFNIDKTGRRINLLGKSGS